MKTIISLLAGLMICSCLSGCYIYSQEPLPPPAVIIAPPAAVVVPPAQRQPAPPPAPSGPPAGAIGPPR